MRQLARLSKEKTRQPRLLTQKINETNQGRANSAQKDQTANNNFKTDPESSLTQASKRKLTCKTNSK